MPRRRVGDARNSIDASRRRFLTRAAATIAAAHAGGLRSTTAFAAPRQLAAIGRARDWINAAALGGDSLAGKIVLVDFWTYTCINWMRTLPYLRAWARQYRDRAVVIGVHTPEFGFEHDVDNVRRAARQLNIEYPIAIDNDYAIWRAFDNQYWPALYFIDARGRVREHRFGEGGYGQAEVTLQRLLEEAGQKSTDGPSLVDPNGTELSADWENLKSPETYVGYERAEHFASPGGMLRDRTRDYTTPPRLALNQWALVGAWTIGKQAAALGGTGGRIVYRFHARDLNLVAAPRQSARPVTFRVSLDGHEPGTARGVDLAADGSGTVLEPRLHQLIRQPRPVLDRTFEIEFLDGDVEAFSFTFG
jgi:thiol-disulfide isomerase/thioredoxin